MFVSLDRYRSGLEVQVAAPGLIGHLSFSLFLFFLLSFLSALPFLLLSAVHPFS